MTSIATRKSLLRKDLKNRRDALSEVAQREKNRAIEDKLLSLLQLKESKSVFCYLSCGAEVHTHDIINTLISGEKQLAVPKIVPPGQMIAVAFRNWKELEVGLLGILTPVKNAPVMSKFDITITPGLGFSTAGDRLGYGKGYYDNWFRAHDGGVRVALAYELQILEQVPSTEQDIKVDLIITEDRIIHTHTALGSNGMAEV